jgi:hypothetical protein
MARRAGEKMGYTLGLTTRKEPYEFPLRTNAGDFQAMLATEGGYYAIGDRLPRGDSGRSRLAGEAFNVNLNNLAEEPILENPYAAGGEVDDLQESLY